jgi:hypothetical protein
MYEDRCLFVCLDVTMSQPSQTAGFPSPAFPLHFAFEIIEKSLTRQCACLLVCQFQTDGEKGIESVIAFNL